MNRLLCGAMALIAALSCAADETLDYAAEEARRLFSRAGAEVKVRTVECPMVLSVVPQGKAEPPFPSVEGVRFDGYAVLASHGAYAVAAKESKGVLNGLYALLERLGYSFVMPGEAGEHVPAKPNAVPDGTWTENPRFRHRGVFLSTKPIRYTEKETYAFFAKLRFNALTSHIRGEAIPEDAFAKTLGLRLEIGGHGMSACLPRARFEQEPELFRMFQPEDFGGKRMKDSNFCATNPKTREIVKANFKKKLEPAVSRGYHAVHGWADDLPGGGWCMCSRCRALLGSDQSQHVMNLEAQAVREMGADMRVPTIAYHDTMFPSETINPDPLCYFLFAPRERCYAHAINDRTCPLNRHYMRALSAWTEKFKDIDDSHTFEYYSDKLLFRGHAPYLPDVIIGDGDAYEKAGIACWMSLHVGGNFVAPDWTMLAHAIVAWEAGLSRSALTHRLSMKLGDGTSVAAWSEYLDKRATAYETAWRICNVPSGLYFDYRFMPERPSDRGGAELVANLSAGERTLAEAADGLSSRREGMTAFARGIAEQQIAYDCFAMADLAAMAAQQRGLTGIADHWNGADTLAAALSDLRTAVGLLKKSRGLYAAAVEGFETDQYYLGFVDNWAVPEIENKIRVYESAR